jgi:hypothetical protein
MVVVLKVSHFITPRNIKDNLTNWTHRLPFRAWMMSRGVLIFVLSGVRPENHAIIQIMRRVLEVFRRHPSRFAQIERWGLGLFKGNKSESIMLQMPDTNLWTRMLP